jgi:peptide/nickel transport system substrate-binding protein
MDLMHRAGSSERAGGNSAVRRSRVRAAAATSLAAVTALAVSAGVASASSHAHSSIGSANKQTPEYGTVVAGTLPSSGTAKSGGTLTEAQLSGQTPTAIFPLTTGSDSNTASQMLVTDMYSPVFYGPNGARPEVNYALSQAAGPPKASHGDKTFTITLKSGLKFSNGTAVTSTDVEFFFDLLKAALKASPANWGQYSPGLFPDNVTSVSTPSPTKFVINLKKATNPGYFLYNELQDTNWGLYALPASSWDIDAAGGSPVTDWNTNPADALKIYTYLEAQGTSLSTFASNPLWQVVDGPFKLSSFNATNSSYTLVPNKSYSLSVKPKVSEVEMNTYTSETAVLDALKTGSLDIGPIDAATQLGSIPELKSDGYSVFGTPGFGWYGGIINFKDTTDDFNKIIVQPYVDQALAELINQNAIIKGVYHGWAVPASGPIPSAPTSPYAPASSAKAVFPFNPKGAAALLKAHGWDVKPGGQTVCAKAGTGASDCGAGIPKGTPFKFVWANVPESTAATGVLESQAFASQAKASAGVNITLTTKTFNFLVTDYNDANPAAKKYTNDWAVNNFGGIQFDYYPTQDGLLSPGAGFNEGDYDNAEAIKLMNASASSNSATAVQKEDEFESKQYPVFWMPDEDQINAVSSKVGASTTGLLELGSQIIPSNYFYLKK